MVGSSAEKAQLIYEAVSSCRKNPYQLSFDGSLLTTQLQSFIDKGEPIRLLIPAFHGKAKYQTFNHLPDYGEFLGVANLVNLCKSISDHYENGVELTIIHEGYFYVDMPFARADVKVKEYMDKFESLIAPYSFIKSISLPEFFPLLETNAQRRAEFENLYEPSNEEIKYFIERDCREKLLYLSYKKIYSKTYRSTLFPHLSVKELSSTASEYAKSQLKLYLGFGRLVKEYFKNIDYIRLSTLYKSPDVINQLAINYLPGVHHLATPAFHCVLKSKEGHCSFIKYSEGIRKNYKVSEYLGYQYFEG